MLLLLLLFIGRFNVFCSKIVFISTENEKLLLKTQSRVQVFPILSCDVGLRRYLRKALFAHHPDLKFAGLLNPLVGRVMYFSVTVIILCQNMCPIVD